MDEKSLKPRIRFKGFTEAWEQRKLIDIASLTKGEQLGKSEMLDTGKYYVLNGGINPSGYSNFYNTKEETISISEGGNSCGYVNYNFEKFWSGGHNYTLFNVKIDNRFLYHYLKFKEDFIMSLRVGTGLPNIQKNRIENDLHISYPKNEEESTKISSFLTNLDSIITLHQRK